MIPDSTWNSRYSTWFNLKFEILDFEIPYQFFILLSLYLFFYILVNESSNTVIFTYFYSEGSILVDYFIELSELGRTVNTADMKRMFHDSLYRSTINSEALIGEASTVDSADLSNQQLRLGKFIVDPKYTDFVGQLK